MATPRNTDFAAISMHKLSSRIAGLAASLEECQRQREEHQATLQTEKAARSALEQEVIKLRSTSRSVAARYENQLTSLQSQLGAATSLQAETARQLEARKIELQQVVASRDEASAALRQQVASLQSQLVATTKNCETSRLIQIQQAGLLEVLEVEMAALGKQVQEARSRLDTQQDLFRDLSDCVSRDLDRQEEMVQHMREMEVTLANARQAVVEHDRVTFECRSESRRLQAELESCQKACQASETHASQAQALLNTTIQDKARLSSLLIASESSLEGARLAMQQHTQAISALMVQHQEQDTRWQQQQQEMKQRREEVQALKEQLRQQQKELEQKEEQLQEVRWQLDQQQQKQKQPQSCAQAHQQTHNGQAGGVSQGGSGRAPQQQGMHIEMVPGVDTDGARGDHASHHTLTHSTSAVPQHDMDHMLHPPAATDAGTVAAASGTSDIPHRLDVSTAVGLDPPCPSPSRQFIPVNQYDNKTARASGNVSVQDQLKDGQHQVEAAGAHSVKTVAGAGHPGDNLVKVESNGNTAVLAGIQPDVGGGELGSGGANLSNVKLSEAAAGGQNMNKTMHSGGSVKRTTSTTAVPAGSTRCSGAVSALVLQQPSSAAAAAVDRPTVDNTSPAVVQPQLTSSAAPGTTTAIPRRSGTGDASTSPHMPSVTPIVNGALRVSGSAPSAGVGAGGITHLARPSGGSTLIAPSTRTSGAAHALEGAIIPPVSGNAGMSLGERMDLMQQQARVSNKLKRPRPDVLAGLFAALGGDSSDEDLELPPTQGAV